MLAENDCPVVYLEEFEFRSLEMVIAEMSLFGRCDTDIESVVLMPTKVSCMQHKKGMKIHFAYSVRK